MKFFIPLAGNEAEALELYKAVREHVAEKCWPVTGARI
jgi:hypothetical protein